MTTFTQAVLLGAERVADAPACPSPALAAPWAQLDWNGPRETALLEACALAAVARVAGSAAAGPFAPLAPSAPEVRRLASPASVAILRELLAEEWRALVPEWLMLCARHNRVVPPFFFPVLAETLTRREGRAAFSRVAGERGCWLARQNPAWRWLLADQPATDAASWDTGTEDERIAFLSRLRAGDPAKAGALVETTWADEPWEFRVRALGVLQVGLTTADEPFLTRVLGDRRREVRSEAQGLLALLPQTAFAARLLARADALVSCQRGFLSRKLEVTLPAAFDPDWKADGIQQAAPPGIGEKAFWAQQILGLVPVRHWVDRFGVPSTTLFDLARKSSDWGPLLLGAWFRAATLHRESGECGLLLPLVLAEPKLFAPLQQTAAIGALLTASNEVDRWRAVALDPAVAWAGLGLLMGEPTTAQARALLANLAPAMRDGFNIGGSPGAVLAARCVLPSLRDEAERLLRRDQGFSKPAEAFLTALDKRAALQAAFAASESNFHP